MKWLQYWRSSLRAALVLCATQSCQAISDVIELFYDDWFVSESDGQALFPVDRHGDSTGPASVFYSTADQTARTGIDYVSTSGRVAFGAGEVSKTIAIPIIDNAIVDGTRSLTVTLSDPVGATLGLNASFKLFIPDNERLVMIDPTFNVSTDGQVNSVTPYPDGHLLIAGDFSTINEMGSGNAAVSRCGLARLNNDGTVDQSFDPRIAFPFCVFNGARLFPLTLLPDGKMMVSATVEKSIPGGSEDVALTGRLQPDGTVDPTFKPDQDVAGQFFPQTDGTWLRFDGGNLERLDTNGTFLSVIDLHLPDCLGVNDPDIYRIREPGGFAFARQPDGKFLIGGTVNCSRDSNVALLRRNPDGSPDPDFRPVVITGEPLGAETRVKMVLLSPTGQIVIAGSFEAVNGVARTNLARLNADGTLDLSFEAHSDNSFVPFVATAALQPDGKVLVWPGIPDEGDPWPAYRLNTDGSLDSTFRTAGTDQNPILGLQPDGSIILNGPDHRLLRLFAHSEKLTGFTMSADGDFSSPETTVVTAVSGGKARVNVYRLGPTTGSASVNFQTMDSEARAGVDYIARTGTLRFGPLETVKAVEISVMGNANLKTEKSFWLGLLPDDQTSLLGIHSSDAKITIAPQQSLGIRYETSSTSAVVRLTLAPVMAGIQYQIESSPDPTFSPDSLNRFQDQVGSFRGLLEFTETNTIGHGQRFYRIMRLGP